MGIYNINCASCGNPFQWWSGNLDQRCSSCINKKQEDSKSKEVIMKTFFYYFITLRFFDHVNLTDQKMSFAAKFDPEKKEQLKEMLEDKEKECGLGQVGMAVITNMVPIDKFGYELWVEQFKDNEQMKYSS